MSCRHVRRVYPMANAFPTNHKGHEYQTIHAYYNGTVGYRYVYPTGYEDCLCPKVMQVMKILQVMDIIKRSWSKCIANFIAVFTGIFPIILIFRVLVKNCLWRVFRGESLSRIRPVSHSLTQ